MAKSFCTGCKYWVMMDDGYYRFRYCERIKKFDLSDRKLLCNGKYREDPDGKENRH